MIRILIIILLMQSCASAPKSKPHFVLASKHNACDSNLYKSEIDLLLCKKQAEIDLKQCKDDKTQFYDLLKLIVGLAAGVLGKIGYDNLK